MDELSSPLGEENFKDPETPGSAMENMAEFFYFPEGENNQGIRELVKNAPLGIFSVTMGGKYRWANRCLALILGYSSPEALMEEVNRTSVQECHYANPGTRDPVIADLLSHPNEWGSREELFRKRDGTMIDVQLHYRCVFSPQGEPLYLDGFLEDIGTRKELERQITRQLSLQRRIFDSIPAHVYLKDVQGKYVAVNSAFAEFMNRPREEFEGKSVFDILPEDVALASKKEDDQVLTTGKEVAWAKLLAVGWEGRRQWQKTSKSPLFDEQGEVSGIIGCSFDITPLVETAEALRKSERRYRSLAEDMPVLISTALPDGTFLYVNRECCRWYGMEEKDLLGESLFQFLTEGDLENFRAGLAAMTPENSLLVSEQRFFASDGSIQWLRWITRGFFDTEGRLQFLQGIGEDVTESKRAEEILRKARDEAERTSAAKSTFVATVSHEIRTPLNGILGMTEVLLDTDLNGHQRNYARIIRDSGAHLLTLLNDLLDFAKIEAGRFDLNIIPFPLDRILSESLAIFQGEADERGIRISLKTDPTLPSVLAGDPLRVRQILANLLGNAVKFTSRGSVLLSVKKRKETDKEVTVRFSVVDTGIGIPRQIQKEIFIPFHQGESFNNRKFSGTGLGLPISDRLLRMMGSRLLVKSVPGKGSCFFFSMVFQKHASLPASPLSLETLSSPHPKQETGGPVPSILVVDDNDINLELVRILLKRGGYRPLLAKNGREAIELLSREKADLVLMDIQMPGMNGYETTAVIRDPSSPVLDHSLPIVALTAHAMKGFAEECLKLGLNDVLTKPFSSHELLEMISRWLLRGKKEKLKSEEVSQGRDAGSEKKIFDAVSFFEKFGGDPGEGRMLLELFLDRAAADMERGKESADKEDYAGCSMAGHSLKGAAANVCAPLLSHRAEDFENEGKNNSPLVMKVWKELEEQFLLVRGEMEKWIKSLSGPESGHDREP